MIDSLNIDPFQFTKSMILYSDYNYSKTRTNKETKELQEKSAQKFEKFFAKLNDSIGMEFKTSKKMDVIKRFYEKYNV